MKKLPHEIVQRTCGRGTAKQKDKLIMRWFWVGFFVSIPVSFFILGNEKHTASLVSKFSILYGLTQFAVVFIYRKWKGIRLGIRLEDTVPKNSTAITYFLYSIYSVVFVAGHAIGFATIHLFRNVL